MTDRPVNLYSSGPPETVIDPEPAEAIAALAEAETAADPIAAIGSVCTRWPTFLAAWASLGDVVAEPALKYAAYRTGYHRGLDKLRASGWRGSGYVRWQHETNRGFLRALAGLQASAAAIGESAEDERCAIFLRQLDPEWPPS
ncbi:MAG: DUF3151 family protein [Acidimicrobiaceae bacterium]|jgi:hypothetical protein